MQQKLVEMEKGWKNVERKYMEDQKGLGSNVEYLVLVRLTLEITFVGILNFPRYIFSGGGRETSVFNDLHKLEGTNILSLDSFRGSLPLISQPKLTGATKTGFLTAFLKLPTCSNFSRSWNQEMNLTQDIHGVLIYGIALAFSAVGKI